MTRRNRKKIDTIIFLGAGASCSDGAPLQGNLFREFFQYNIDPLQKTSHPDWDQELEEFFNMFFGIDVRDLESLNDTSFPTFEEVLGILEIAESQNESFQDWGASNLDAQTKPRIQNLHEILILMIAEILDYKLQKMPTNHPKLIESLNNVKWLPNTAFMSLNYDILIDNALMAAKENFDLDLDYSIDFINYGPEWKRPRLTKQLSLFKLHGSLNWLYCPTCRAIRITPKVKGICRLIWQPNECVCTSCETLAVPIIIPPTYFKVLSNLYLRQIWHAAEQALRECRRLIFCGYSFPDADLHVRYLLKRIEVNTRRTPEVFIVNEHNGKTNEARTAENNRYRRFFSR